jgi:hypothetical protein
MLAWWLFQKLVLPIQTRLASSRHIIAGGFNLVNLWGWKDHSIVAPGTKGTTSTCITKGTTSTRGAAIFISSGMSGAGHVARNDICFSFTKPTDEAANWPRVLKVGQCQPCIPGTNLPELASALFFFKTHKVVRFHLGGGLPSLFGI